MRSREDALSIQNDIDLNAWSEKWLLKFNTDKSYVIKLGQFDKIMHTHRYTLYHVFEEKDLGSILDMEMTFQEHMVLKVK